MSLDPDYMAMPPRRANAALWLNDCEIYVPAKQAPSRAFYTLVTLMLLVIAGGFLLGVYLP